MKKNRPVLRFFTLASFAGLFSSIVGVAAVYLYLAPSLPSVDSLRNIQLQTPLRIYTADYKLMAEFGEKRRTPVAYDDVPQRFFDALIAAEDEDFHSHMGIDLKGLARAAFELITTGEKRSGGSTLTMQVAKNYFLSSEKTFTRKFTEIMLALHIEQELTKTEILELYVNKIYFGKRAYGIQAAAQVYYGLPIHDLNLAQLAMLAGLPQAPSAANPINNPDRAKYRRNYVLARMFTADLISQEEFDEAGSAPISAKYHGLSTEVEAPYIAEMVRSELLKQYPDDLYTQGYRVYTTVRSDLQTAAQTAVRNGLHAYDRAHGLRTEAVQLSSYVLPEQQNVAVTFSPTNWKLGDPSPASDRFIDLPPSPHDLNLNFWRQQILTDTTYGDTVWAVVSRIDADEVQAVTAAGQIVTLPKTSYEWARPYISVNQVGAPIQQASNLFSVGQKILLQPEGEQYWLAQIPETQSSLISFDPQSGALIALVGGYDFNHSKFNRAIQADRQPGSAFKPFIYSSALERNFTPASLINDAPVVFEDDGLEASWRPENYSGKFFGPTRLRQALYKSRNLVSIRLLRQTGITRTINYVSQFGIPKDKLNRDLSLALGSSGITPIQLANAYNVLANGGYRVEPHFISRVESIDSEVLFEHSPQVVCESCLKAISQHKENNSSGMPHAGIEPSVELAALNNVEGRFPPLAPRVMDPKVNYIMYTMLQDVVKRGTGRRALALGRNDLAGKTGTTNDQKDAWFSGFNNKIVTTVWVGFDTPKTMGRNAYGSNTALPIWVEYMKTAVKDMPESPIKQPDGLVSVRIDPETGKRAYPGQSNAIFEIFREENIPQEMASPEVFNLDAGPVIGGEEEIAPEQLF